MSNETERTLHELKLPGMASCWSSLEETHQLDKLTLREGMQIMLQYERDTRGNNRIQRLIKNAGLKRRSQSQMWLHLILHEGLLSVIFTAWSKTLIWLLLCQVMPKAALLLPDTESLMMT